MNFSELEQLMSSRGIASLADIARTLNTTPQAVSNWKSRDQIPYHIVNKLEIGKNKFQNVYSEERPQVFSTYDSSKEENFTLTRFLLVIAQQLKLIFLIFFIFLFSTYFHVRFIEKPKYISSATILLPEINNNNFSGMAGLASQFGVSIPSSSKSDLSSPSLLPELLLSRTFAEKILDKKFYTKRFNKELTLLQILTNGDVATIKNKERLSSQAASSFQNMIELDKFSSKDFSIISVISNEPIFAKTLLDTVLFELEKLNRFYKSKAVSEKTSFIEMRITSVEKELKSSEEKLKVFNERNRQISSPALELEQDRLISNVDIQKGIFLTLKQQLELAKIEEVQESSIFQILDEPQIPLGPSNKNIKLNLVLSGIVAGFVSVFLAFFRGYINNENKDERKKLRRIRNIIYKKSKDVFKDWRILGVINLAFLIGLPFYLGSQSKNPIFFNMYSPKDLLINIIYLLILLILTFKLIHIYKNNRFN